MYMFSLFSGIESTSREEQTHLPETAGARQLGAKLLFLPMEFGWRQDSKQQQQQQQLVVGTFSMLFQPNQQRNH